MAPLRAERRFICQHLSGHGKCFEVYYRSFRAADEGFHFYCLEAGGGIIAPHCTGGSWGWRLAAARGAYRLLARCEILPCMLCLLVPDPLLPREMGCQRFPQGKKACTLVFYYPLSVSGRKEKHAFPLFFYSGACDSREWAYLYFLWFPININQALWPLIYHSIIIKILLPHAAFIIKNIGWLPSL